MKIRNGFVSNSSSSSFVLFGLEDVSEPDTEKVLKWITKSTSLEEVEKKWKVWYSEKKATTTNPEWYSEETLVEWLESVLDDGFGELSYNLDWLDEDFANGIEWISSDSGSWCGYDPTKMPLDMTMGDWIEQSTAKLKELFGDDINPKIMCETYYC